MADCNCNAQSMYAQCNLYENDFLLLDSFIDYMKWKKAFTLDKQKIEFKLFPKWYIQPTVGKYAVNRKMAQPHLKSSVT